MHEWALDQHRSVVDLCLSETIVYTAPDIGSVVIEGVAVGFSRSQVLSAEGVAVEVRQRDFIIPKERILIGGDVIEPMQGHQITWAKVPDVIFEVTNRGQEQGYDYWDQFEQVLRVHTEKCASGL
jgi:hypothetical protein